MTNYARHLNPAAVPQTEPLPGVAQVRNDAGGYVYALDKWQALRRFLILGTEGGTYYASERKHTLRATDRIKDCVAENPKRALEAVVEALEGGLAPRKDPAILVLALMASMPGVDHSWALDELPRLCRTGTDILHFAAAVNELRGWGPALRKAIGRWYARGTAEELAYQLVKYQSRDGWSHRDVLRLCHLKPPSGLGAPLCWAVGKLEDGTAAPPIIAAFEMAKRVNPDTAEGRRQIVAEIRSYGLTREMIPTRALAFPDVWEALLERMPPMAMVRNLANMSKVGLLTPFSDAERTVVSRLDRAGVERSRLHPMHFFLAGRTYAGGHSRHGIWTPSKAVVAVLDEAFVMAFWNVRPSGKRILLAIDVSGSMASARVANTEVPVCEAAAALALVVAKTEPQVHAVAFDTATYETDLARYTSPHEVRGALRFSGGGTDVSQPYGWLMSKRLEVDAVVTFTDNETWAGPIHLSVLFEEAKRLSLVSKAVTFAMSATDYSTMKDSPDALNVVGLDASAPALASAFLRGEV